MTKNCERLARWIVECNGSAEFAIAIPPAIPTNTDRSRSRFAIENSVVILRKQPVCRTADRPCFV